MKKHRKRIFLIGVAYGEAAGPCGFVEAAHMPPDSHGFLLFKAHIALNHKDGFFAVTVGKLVVDGVIGALFPLSPLVFYVAKADGVKISLTNIVGLLFDLIYK